MHTISHISLLKMLCIGLLFPCYSFSIEDIQASRRSLTPLEQALLNQHSSFSLKKEAAISSSFVLLGTALIIGSVICPSENCSGNGKGFGILAGSGSLMAGLSSLKKITSHIYSSHAQDNV